MTAETESGTREVAARGEDWYEHHLKQLVEPAHLGEFLIVDVNTGDYGMGHDYIQLTERLLAKRPDAVLYTLRVGYPSIGRISGRYMPVRR